MKLIVIVTDIGGPVALHDILSELPANFGLPVVVMQSTTEIIQDSTIATLRRTTALRIVHLKATTSLHPGVVYFAETGKSYSPVPSHGDLELSVRAINADSVGLSQALVGLVEFLGESLTVVFLSGRGNAVEISRLCSKLESSGATILVLNRLESVVDELGRSALMSASSASELGAQQIVETMLTQAESVAGNMKSGQKAAKR